MLLILVQFALALQVLPGPASAQNSTPPEPRPTLESVRQDMVVPSREGVRGRGASQ